MNLDHVSLCRCGVAYGENGASLPIYLVSPDWLVTREHMSSDRASTSSPFFSFSCSLSRTFSLSDGANEGLLLSSSFTGSGEVSELCGVEAGSLCADVASDGEVGVDCAAWEACLDCCCCWAFSAKRFSRVPRSVDSSSSPSRPVGFVSSGPRRARPATAQGLQRPRGGFATRRKDGAHQITSEDSPCAPGGSRGLRCTWHCRAKWVSA